MFDQYSDRDLHHAALVLAAMVTFTFSMQFRRIKDVVASSTCTTGNDNDIVQEAFKEAERLEKDALENSKEYQISLVRVYHPKKTDFFRKPMTRIELALTLVTCKIEGSKIPEPVSLL